MSQQTGNLLYQTTIQPSQQAVTEGTIVTNVITSGTYALDSCFVELDLSVITKSTTEQNLEAASYYFGDQRFWSFLAQINATKDSQITYNCLEPDIVQKKYYDEFMPQKLSERFSSDFTYIGGSLVPQFSQSYSITYAAGNPKTWTVNQTSNYGVLTISMPLKQFLPFMFYPGQQTFNVFSELNIQTRFKADISVPMYKNDLGIEARLTCILANKNMRIVLRKLQNIVIPDQIQSCYQQTVYSNDSVTTSINVPNGSKSNYQIFGKKKNNAAFNDTYSNPDTIAQGATNYTMIASIDSVQQIQADSLSKASSQWKQLDQHQRLQYFTSCCLYHNILSEGTHTINIQQSGPLTAGEQLVIGFQYFK